MAFLNYLHTRRYNFGRGAKSSWAFIAAARGDSRFPDVGSWRELKDYLVETGKEDMVDAAGVVWRTYQRRVQKGELELPDLAPWAGLQRKPDAAGTMRLRDPYPPRDFSLHQLG